MIVVIDYGVGNLFSLVSSLKAVGASVVVSGETDVIKGAEKIILPGVGAFEDAVNKLKEKGLFDLIIERANAGVPLLGICLGMQMLFEKSYEFGEFNGLGLIKGEIRPIKDDLTEDYNLNGIEVKLDVVRK
jgi:glutamine amidotransferase